MDTLDSPSLLDSAQLRTLLLSSTPVLGAVIEQVAGLVLAGMRKAQQELSEPVEASVLPAWGVVELDDRSEVAGRLVLEPGFHGKMLRVEEAGQDEEGQDTISRVILIGVPTIRRVVILPESAVRAATYPGPLPRNPLPVPVIGQGHGLVFPEAGPEDDLDLDEGEDELPRAEDDQA